MLGRVGRGRVKGRKREGEKEWNRLEDKAQLEEDVKGWKGSGTRERR